MVVDLGIRIDNECRYGNLVELLRYQSEHQASKVAYTFLQQGDEIGSLTYAELDIKAQAIAAKLQQLNAVGTRALLMYPPGLDYISAFFGCLYAGVVAVPAYPLRRNQNSSRLLAIIKDAAATVALTTSWLHPDIQNRFTENPELSQLHWQTTDDLADELALAWQPREIISDELAFLQYTSGSTGTPKGVMVSHGNLWHNSGIIHRCFGHTPNSRGVIWLPPYHDMGLIGGILQPLYGGFPVTLMSPADFLQKPFYWLRAVSQYQATTSGAPNFAYDLCVRKITDQQREQLDLSSWELAFIGAEPIRAETLEQFTNTFAACGFRKEAFYPCYGMAETTLIVSGGLKSEPPVVRHIDATALEQNQVVVSQQKTKNTKTIVGCGQSWFEQQVIIVNPESCLPCASGEVGEIWVAGESVTQGYWNRPEETQKMFHAYLADTGAGPFLRTGDLGYWLDQQLFITGRIKDVIIIRGQNHYPQDIELTVEKCHPALRTNSGAAFTVEINGLERLVIVQEVERTYLRNQNLHEVVENIRQAVTAEHGLNVYATVLVKTGSLPKTSSGKIRRHACRSDFLVGSLDVVKDWSENPQNKAKFLHLASDVEGSINEQTTINLLLAVITSKSEIPTTENHATPR
ncbi:fatty acyl-AMP ligase [Nostoc sp. UHCC 0702]|nr:fatty acyl-AMP ligase [Nostoc sp. UHCC 0702]